MIRCRFFCLRYKECFEQIGFVLIPSEETRRSRSQSTKKTQPFLGKTLMRQVFSKTGPFDRVPRSGTCGENGSNKICRLDRALSGGPTAYVSDEKLKR